MDIDLQQFLEPYPPEISDLILRLRSLIMEVIPTAIVQIDPPSKLIGYGIDKKMSGLICTIQPQKGYVNLGIYRGVDLPDPQGLLEGTGKIHRHVRVKSIASIDEPALRALLEAAARAKRH
jgi:hypothetical protein